MNSTTMAMHLWTLSLITCVAGHAYLSRPIGRQLAASTIEGARGSPEHDKQSWSGKGAGNFIANCGSRSVEGKYEDSPDKWETRGRYAAGQVVDFEITFTVQHNGAHGFRIICADDRLGDRLPPFTDAAWMNLKRNRNDPNHMTEFHREHFGEHEWDTLAFLPQAVGNTPATVQFVIPAEFPTCNHAVIQWWWKTANSCTPNLFHGQRGKFTEDANLGDCRIVTPSAECIDGDCQMEQFYNCADVSVAGMASWTATLSTSTQIATTTMIEVTTTTTQTDTTTAADMTTIVETSTQAGTSTTTSAFTLTTQTTTMFPDTTIGGRLQCRALTNQASDEWCTANCNHVPAFCPPAFCLCGEWAFFMAAASSHDAVVTTSSKGRSSGQLRLTTGVSVLSGAICSFSRIVQTIIIVFLSIYCTSFEDIL
jgi:hypothetical protein